MISTNILILLVVLALAINIEAAPNRGQLVRFHPISRAQYNAIMGLTDGKPVISEARLISSGLNGFSELRTLITDDINSGWNRLLNFTGLQAAEENKLSADKDKVEGYPLCVIKTTDLKVVDYDERDDEDERNRNRDDGENDRDDERNMEMGKSEDEDHNHNDKSEETYNNKSRDRRPVINCVVVMRPSDKGDDNDHKHDHKHGHDENDHQHNNGKPKKRRRNKYSNIYDDIPQEFNDYGRFEKPKSSSSSSTSTRMSLSSKSKSKTRDYSQLYYQQLLNNYNEEQEQLLPSYYGIGNPYPAYNYQFNTNAYNPYANFYGNPFYGPPSTATAAYSQHFGNSYDSKEDSHSDEDY